jgi:hypothetical protein
MTDEDATPEPSPPRIDVRGALHMAGHEVHELGFDGVEDSAPLVHDGSPEEHHESAEELAHRIGPDIVGRSRPAPND